MLIVRNRHFIAYDETALLSGFWFRSGRPAICRRLSDEMLIDDNDVIKTTAYVAFGRTNAGVTGRLLLILGGRCTFDKIKQNSGLNGTPVAAPRI